MDHGYQGQGRGPRGKAGQPVDRGRGALQPWVEGPDRQQWRVLEEPTRRNDVPQQGQLSSLIEAARATQAHPERRQHGEEPEQSKPENRIASGYRPPRDRQVGEQHSGPEDGIVRLDPGGRRYAVRPDHQGGADGDEDGRRQLAQRAGRDRHYLPRAVFLDMRGYPPSKQSHARTPQDGSCYSGGHLVPTGNDLARALRSPSVVVVLVRDVSVPASAETIAAWIRWQGRYGGGVLRSDGRSNW